MRIGFVGPHRSGKTTLARLLAEEMEVDLVESAVSDIAKKMKFDMGAKNSIGRRMEFQEKVLVDFLNTQTEREGDFVSDRTPIDAAAYLMADVQATVGTPAQHEEILEYCDAAMRMLSKTYDVVIFVPAAIPVETAEGKPPMNSAYQEHHGMICAGMLCDDQVEVYWDSIPRECTDLEERMECIRAIIQAFEDSE